MVTKGEIQSIDFLNNTCVVRVPLFESAASQLPAILTATFALPPGLVNPYLSGDIVYLAFEDNLVDKPVVIGKLYVNNDAANNNRGSMSINTLDVSTKVTLPLDTKIEGTVASDVANALGSPASYGSIKEIIEAIKATNESAKEATDEIISARGGSLSLKEELSGIKEEISSKYTIVLDNDFDAVPAYEDGHVDESYPWQDQTTHKIVVYSGSDRVNFIVSNTVPTSGTDLTVVYEVSKSDGSHADITYVPGTTGTSISEYSAYVTGFYSNDTLKGSIKYTLYEGTNIKTYGEFSMVKIKSGSSPTDYSFLTDAKAFVVSDDRATITPNTINFIPYTSSAGSKTEITTGTKPVWKYRWDNEAEGVWHEVTNVYTLSIQYGTTEYPYDPNKKLLTVEMYFGGNKWDKEAVSVVLNGIPGADGEDGTSPFKLDISNDFDSIPAINTSGQISTGYDWDNQTLHTLKVYHGDTQYNFQIQGAGGTIPTSGFCITYSLVDDADLEYKNQPSSGIEMTSCDLSLKLKTGKSSIENNKRTINYILYYNGVVVSNAKFELSIILPGEDGEDGQNAVDYYITTTPNSIQKDQEGTKSAATVKIDFYKKIGTQDAVLTTDGFYTTTLDNGSESTTTAIPTGGTISIQTSTFDTKLVVNYYQDNTKAVKYDSETINVISDGSDGQPGSPGAPGANGYNAATLYLYKRAESAAVDWTNDITYAFSTKTWTEPSGWSKSIPAQTAENTNPVWCTAATAHSNTDTVVIAYTEWTTPIKLAENGAKGNPGDPGADAPKIVSVTTYYAHASTAPAAPTVKDPTDTWYTSLPTYDATKEKYWETTRTVYDAPNPTYDFSWSTVGQNSSFAVAQGKSTTYYSSTEPDNPKQGDCWFKQTGTTETSETKGELKQYTGSTWENIGDELVANKVTATYVNALNITAKKIEVKDGTDTIFKADATGSAHDVTIGGFNVTKSALYNGMTSLDDTTHDGIYVGTDGIALGKGNFKVTNGGSITAKQGTFGIFNANNTSINIDNNVNNTMNWGSEGGDWQYTIGVKSIQGQTDPSAVSQGYIKAHFATGHEDEETTIYDIIKAGQNWNKPATGSAAFVLSDSVTSNNWLSSAENLETFVPGVEKKIYLAPKQLPGDPPSAKWPAIKLLSCATPSAIVTTNDWKGIFVSGPTISSTQTTTTITDKWGNSLFGVCTTFKPLTNFALMSANRAPLLPLLIPFDDTCTYQASSISATATTITCNFIAPLTAVTEYEFFVAVTTPYSIPFLSAVGLTAGPGTTQPQITERLSNLDSWTFVNDSGMPGLNLINSLYYHSDEEDTYAVLGVKIDRGSDPNTTEKTIWPTWTYNGSSYIGTLLHIIIHWQAPLPD